MSDASPSPAEIGALQRQVLRAVLSRAPLPGGAEPVNFPDLGFVTSDGGAWVLDENYQGPSSGPAEAMSFVAPDDVGVRVVSRDEVERRKAGGGEVGFLVFQPPVVQGDEVRLTLEARLASGDPSKRPMGLGGMQFILRNEGGRWVGTPQAAVAM